MKDDLRNKFMDSQIIKSKIKETINKLISKNIFSKEEITKLFSDKDFCSNSFGILGSVLFSIHLSNTDYCNCKIYPLWTEGQWQKFSKWGENVEKIKTGIETIISKLISENIFSEEKITKLLSDKDFCYSAYETKYPILFPSSNYNSDCQNYHVFPCLTDEQYQRFSKWEENVEKIKLGIETIISKLISENIFSEEEITKLLSDKEFCYSAFDTQYSILFPSTNGNQGYNHVFPCLTDEQYQKFLKWKESRKIIKSRMEEIEAEIEAIIKRLVFEKFFSNAEIRILLSSKDFCYKMFGNSNPMMTMPAGQVNYFNILSSWTKEQYEKFYKWSFTYKTISKSIKVGEFKNSDLQSVIIQSPADSIGSGAFMGCKNLSFVKIPTSINYIGANAFAFCPNLHLYFDSPSYWCVGHSIKQRSYFERIFISNSENIPKQYLDCWLFKDS